MVLHWVKRPKLSSVSMFMLGFLALAIAPSAYATLWVQWKDEHLSVVAEQVPLAQLVHAIAKQTGMEIRVESELEIAVSIRFKELLLEEAFERLFVNSLVIWRGAATPQPRPLLALVSGLKAKSRALSSPSKVVKKQAEAHQEEDESINDEDDSAAHEERLARLHAAARQGDVEALRTALVDDVDPAMQMTAFNLLAEQNRERAVTLLTEMTKADQMEKRLQALQLAYQAEQANPGTTMSILGTALSDEDSSVKGYAIQALAALEGNEATSYLQQALHDPDASVRLLAVEEISRRNDSRLLLHEALGDNDAAVREHVSALLNTQPH